MKSTKNKRLYLFFAIVLLIAMTACAKSSSKEESSQAGSSVQIEEAQPAEETAADQVRPTSETTADQVWPTDETTAEQGQPTGETTAEQGQPTDETTAEEARTVEDAMQLLQQADEIAEEKYDNLDLNDKASVIEMIQALDQMNYAIFRATDSQREGGDADEKAFSVAQEIRCVDVSDFEFTTFVNYMKGRKGLVILQNGGDTYIVYYVCDGTLIGCQSGYSTGDIGFSGSLPDWKDDPAGDTHSIIDGQEVSDHHRDRNYEEEAEYVEKCLKEAEEILESKE